jgi:hypothetical protein
MSEQPPSSVQPCVSSESIRSPSWNLCLEQALRESDRETLLPLIHATEAALYLRWEQVGSDPAHTQERAAMEAAAGDLLAIKIHKLGWPDPCPQLPRRS